MVALTAIGAHAGPAAAADTQAVMTQDTLAWINRDREAKGLTKYRPWAPLNAIAAERAASMASRDQLSHDAAGGDLGAAYDQTGIQWYGWGEIIGESNATFGKSAAAFIYKLWKGSPPHSEILFSSHYNYIGIGFAYRPSNGTTWASIVFADSKDHTAPLVARNGRHARGRTVTFAWRGHDRVLQTREAGFGSFDVDPRGHRSPNGRANALNEFEQYRFTRPTQRYAPGMMTSARKQRFEHEQNKDSAGENWPEIEQHRR